MIPNKDVDVGTGYEHRLSNLKLSRFTVSYIGISNRFKAQSHEDRLYSPPIVKINNLRTKDNAIRRERAPLVILMDQGVDMSKSSTHPSMLNQRVAASWAHQDSDPCLEVRIRGLEEYPCLESLGTEGADFIRSVQRTMAGRQTLYTPDRAHAMTRSMREEIGRCEEKHVLSSIVFGPDSKTCFTPTLPFYWFPLSNLVVHW
jgi:hypothetical protein